MKFVRDLPMERERRMRNSWRGVESLEQQPAAQVGHEEHSSQQARFAMMQRFLEMQKENALLIRQTNPTS